MSTCKQTRMQSETHWQNTSLLQIYSQKHILIAPTAINKRTSLSLDDFIADTKKIYRNIQEPPEQASTIHAPCARQILKTSVSRGNISIILALRAFLYFRFSLAPHSYKTHQIPWVSFFTEHINSYQRKDQSKIASSSDSACFAGIKFVWERSQIMHRNYSWLIRQSYHMQHQYDWHPAIRASFFRLHQGEEKAVLPETRQAFEVATIQTSRLVDLVPSRQTSFSGTSILLIIYR